MPMNTNLINIPEYTADDYYNSSAPYEFLWEHRNDKFMLQQLIQKMKVKAGAVGVRSFMSLWNSYCEMVTRQHGIIVENSTNFEGQELEIMSGEYLCDERGVYLQDKFGYENCVCRHPIMPILRLCNIDSGEERMKIAYKKGKIWRTLIVEKSVIASSNGILQLAANGVMVNSENAKALSTYLMDVEQINYDALDEQKSVGRLGWVGEHGFSPYVDGLSFDGENNFKHIFNAVQSNGDRQKWIDAMLAVRAEKSAGRLFLAASFASVILEPCGLLPFFLHAWGGTEVGKTVGLMIAASVWASPKMGDYITTFNSTLVGQEMMATFLNSMPMCIDELQIQSSAGVRDFDKIIYQMTEGVGRTRGAKTGGLQKVNTWKNCFITNGESPISNVSSGGGAVNRIIEFECAEKVYSDLVGLCGIINANYGFAGREFVEYLQSESAFERVNALQKDFYRELLKSDSTDKQAASASAILAADSLVTELIFKDNNALTVEDMAAIMTKKEEVNANSRALEYIYELVARNSIHFRGDLEELKTEIWGKTENGCIYIIKSVFDREMGNAGYNSTSFLAWAKRRGIIQCETNKRTKKARIAGRLVNCVVIQNNFEQNVFTELDYYEDELPL